MAESSALVAGDGTLRSLISLSRVIVAYVPDRKGRSYRLQALFRHPLVPYDDKRVWSLFNIRSINKPSNFQRPFEPFGVSAQK
jgi:hypothetical protein